MLRAVTCEQCEAAGTQCTQAVYEFCCERCVQQRETCSLLSYYYPEHDAIMYRDGQHVTVNGKYVSRRMPAARCVVVEMNDYRERLQVPFICDYTHTHKKKTPRNRPVLLHLNGEVIKESEARALGFKSE